MAYERCREFVRRCARWSLVFVITGLAVVPPTANWAVADILPRRRAARSKTYYSPNKMPCPPACEKAAEQAVTTSVPVEAATPAVQTPGPAPSPVVAAPAPEESGFQQLFDGKSLAGWRANENQDSWKVVDGRIVCHGPRSHLFYVGPDAARPADFTNFHFKADVMTKPGANSGIFFHTAFQPEGWPVQGYEMQVNNSQKDPVRTGSIYNVVKNFIPPAADNEWFTEEVIVKGKAVTVLVNGKVLFEFVEPEGVTGTRKLSHGTFALQAHDPGSEVHYKNIRVKPLP